MESFATLIGQYNSVALTLTDKDYGHVALDSKSRIIFDHTTSSTKLGDGQKIISILEEDVASVGGEKGIGFIGVRKDVIASLVDTDGDYTMAQFDAQGRLRVDAEVSVTTGSDKEEDTTHASGAIGCFNLGISNEALTDLCSDDGDYVGFATDKKGQLFVKSEAKESGIEADIGVDEIGDGLVDVIYHATNFVDVAEISVGVGETLFIKGLDLATDHLVHGRLVVTDDDALTKVIRAFPITENIGYINLDWLRAIEVVGGATIKVVLQARCLRVAKTAHVGGGINAYKR